MLSWSQELLLITAPLSSDSLTQTLWKRRCDFIPCNHFLALKLEGGFCPHNPSKTATTEVSSNFPAVKSNSYFLAFMNPFSASSASAFNPLKHSAYLWPPSHSSLSAFADASCLAHPGNLMLPSISVFSPLLSWFCRLFQVTRMIFETDLH